MDAIDAGVMKADSPMGTVRLMLLGGAFWLMAGCASTGKVPDWDEFPDRPKVHFAARGDVSNSARMGIPLPHGVPEPGVMEGLDPGAARG